MEFLPEILGTSESHDLAAVNAALEKLVALEATMRELEDDDFDMTAFQTAHAALVERHGALQPTGWRLVVPHV